MFENINEQDIKKIINKLDGRKMTFRKGTTVMSNISNINEIGLISRGSCDLLKYDLNGNITILDSLKENEIFGSLFSASTEYSSVITTSESEIIYFNINTILDKCIKKENHSDKLIYNMMMFLNKKITDLNNRIEILTKRTTREKIMKYFENECNKKASTHFYLNISYTHLADFLSVDRSAMTREIKHLKEEGFIEIIGKKITINKY